MNSLYFLGTGTSCGVPVIGCNCKVCKSHDPRDHRLRTSAILETDKGTSILFDCGPDFRQQMLSRPFKPIDGVLLTHEHYDHVGGLDDLRPYCAFKGIDIYADSYCAQHLKERIPYCFADKKYPGVPNIALHVVNPDQNFNVAEVTVQPIQVMHGKLPILGYRIGDLAYITDMSQISLKEIQKIKGLKVLIINALRTREHHSHQTLQQALNLIEEVSPSESYLIHMSHEIGLHAEVSSELPPHIHLAYDGLIIRW